MRPDCTDFRQLFLDDVPMMDMRAPVEFAKGAFPGAVTVSYTHLTLPTKRIV